MDSKTYLLDIFRDNNVNKISAADLRKFVEAVYSEKLSVTDVIDNLGKQEPKKALSANMGFELGEAIKQLSTMLSDVETKVSTNEIDIKALHSKSSDNETNISNITIELQDNKKEIDTNTQEINGLKTSISQSVVSITDNRKDILDLQQKATGNSNDIRTLDSKINVIDGTISNIKPNVATNTAKISDHEKRINAIENKATPSVHNSTATDVAGLVADFNNLLASLRTAGIIS